MNYEIRFIKDNEVNSAKELFINCFESEKKEAELFFSPSGKQIVGAFKGAELCSMFTVFECRALLGQEKIKASYLAGVATAVKHRGNKLFERCFEFYCSNSEFDFIFCIPASESLFSLYERAGLTEKSYIIKAKVKALESFSNVKQLSYGDNLDEYFSASDKLYAGNGVHHIAKPRDLREAVVNSYLLYGGIAVIGDDFTALYRKENDEVIIADLICANYTKGVTSAVSAVGDNKETSVTLPPLPGIKGITTSIAACMKRDKSIDISSLYINVLFNDI
ncbi:MAG: GNAT family N-acetyltransferase [Eubacteriales bacterium]|nr:GNAT family N-acetyltransferase [Eubacteriales bacterium]